MRGLTISQQVAPQQMKNHITLVALAAEIAIKLAEEHLMHLRPGLMRGNQAENGFSQAVTATDIS